MDVRATGRAGTVPIGLLMATIVLLAFSVADLDLASQSNRTEAQRRSHHTSAVTMVVISAVTASFITNSVRSAWFIWRFAGVYAIFAMTLHMLPPRT
jgi:hypothetical protein